MPSARRYLCEDEKADMKECLFAEKRVSRSIICYEFAHLILFFDDSFSVSNICISTGKDINLPLFNDRTSVSFFSSVKKNLPFPEDPLIDGYNWPSFKFIN